MRRGPLTSALAAALLMSTAFAGASAAASSAAAPHPAFGGLGARLGLGGYIKRPRWTNASYRRAAAKKHRVAANRRAHRG